MQEKTITYLGVELEVFGNTTAFCPGRSHELNGEAGYPDEGGETTITAIKVGGIDIIDLLEHHFETITQLYEN